MTVDDRTKYIGNSGCTIWFDCGVYAISGSQGLLEHEFNLPFMLVNSFVFIFGIVAYIQLILDLRDCLFLKLGDYSCQRMSASICWDRERTID